MSQSNYVLVCSDVADMMLKYYRIIIFLNETIVHDLIVTKQREKNSTKKILYNKKASSLQHKPQLGKHLVFITKSHREKHFVFTKKATVRKTLRLYNIKLLARKVIVIWCVLKWKLLFMFYFHAIKSPLDMFLLYKYNAFFIK